MNKTAIKSAVIGIRHRLLELAKQRAGMLGATPKNELCEALTASPELRACIRRKGFDQVMEEAACSWFVRFLAWRYVRLKGSSCPLPERAEMQLLLPDELRETDGVLAQLVAEIPEEIFRKDVRSLGWLYQYYNSQLKDDTFAQLKKNIKISKERIPAATQLFTPEWIVRYLVENSLGRIYVNQELNLRKGQMSEAQRVCAEREIASKMGWHYYLPETEQSPETRRECSGSEPPLDLKSIRVIDPCMGAGHILVYAFDVLMQIYRAQGWQESDAAKSILRNNLYGLDIDEQAQQLTAFALMTKAETYCSEIQKGEIIPTVFAVQNGDFLTDALIASVSGGNEAVKGELMLLRSAFEAAEEYGSLIDVPRLDFSAIDQCIGSAQCQTRVVQQLRSLVTQAQLLAGKYDVVVTNPPYMGASSMSDALSRFVKAHYPDSKSDLYAVFMERCTRMMKTGGYQAMITQHSWMFLRSYEKLRNKLRGYDTVNMAHLGARAFEEIAGVVVQTTGFVLRNTHTGQYKATYCGLTAPVNPKGKEELFLSGKSRYYMANTDFAKLPGSPVAYWISAALIQVFASGSTVGSFAASKQGIATANNAHYLRLWHECEVEDIFFCCTSHERSAADQRKWYPYNKGDGGRKWYGNDGHVINWYRDGQALRADPKAVIRNPDFFFKRSVSWSLVCSGIPAFRLKPEGQLFDVAGMSCFSEAYLHYLLALFNSKVAFELLKVLAPTINYQCGDIANIPVKLDENRKHRVEALAQSNVELAKQDWDSFETSWDFKKHPLI